MQVVRVALYSGLVWTQGLFSLKTLNKAHSPASRMDIKELLDS